MTKTFTAEIADFIAKTEAKLTAVVRQSANDVIVLASRTAPGVTRGGSVKKGFVPRDLGTLAASLMSTLHGSTMLTTLGEDSYRMVISSMEAGDAATFVWTAPYARPMHYGYTTSTGRHVGGWMWVDEAANAWSGIVARNAARVAAI